MGLFTPTRTAAAEWRPDCGTDWNPTREDILTRESLVGKIFPVRLVNDRLPNAVIDVAFHGANWQEYYVVLVVRWVICATPSRPADTITWSRTLGWGLLYPLPEPAAAEESARDLANAIDAGELSVRNALTAFSEDAAALVTGWDCEAEARAFAEAELARAWT